MPYPHVTQFETLQERARVALAEQRRPAPARVKTARSRRIALRRRGGRCAAAGA